MSTLPSDGRLENTTTGRARKRSGSWISDPDEDGNSIVIKLDAEAGQILMFQIDASGTPVSLGSENATVTMDLNDIAGKAASFQKMSVCNEVGAPKEAYFLMTDPEDPS